MSGVKYVALGWGAFVGTHMVMSHPSNRRVLVQKLGGGKDGENKFLGIYSAVAFITGGPLVYYYIKRGRLQGRLLWDLSGSYSAKVLQFGLQATAAVVLFQQFSKPVIEIKDEQDESEVQETVTGIRRITRHAMFLSLAILGGSFLLKRVHTADLVFWSGFPAFFLIGGWHQDYRHQTTGVHPHEYFDKTSLLPFKAILEGRNSMQLAIKEMDPKVTVSAVGFVGLLRLLPYILRAIRK